MIQPPAEAPIVHAAETLFGSRDVNKSCDTSLPLFPTLSSRRAPLNRDCCRQNTSNPFPSSSRISSFHPAEVEENVNKPSNFRNVNVNVNPRGARGDRKIDHFSSLNRLLRIVRGKKGKKIRFDSIFCYFNRMNWKAVRGKYLGKRLEEWKDWFLKEEVCRNFHVKTNCGGIGGKGVADRFRVYCAVVLFAVGVNRGG